MTAEINSKSPVLGLASIFLAAVAVTIIAGVGINAANWEGGSWYLTIGFYKHVALWYLCTTVCLFGFVLGFEGYRRPTSPKLISLAGAILNATLLLVLTGESSFVRSMIGPIDV